jgi:hypothetical protein
MHASQMESSEFLAISDMGHFGPSGGRFEQFDMVLLPIPSHSAQCKGAGQENWIPFTYGEKGIGPTPVAQKCGHRFYIALLNRWLPAGKMERHGWIVCSRQAD